MRLHCTSFCTCKTAISHELSVSIVSIHSNALKEEDPTKISPEPGTTDDGQSKEPEVLPSRQGKRSGSLKSKEDTRRKSVKPPGKPKAASPVARTQSPALLETQLQSMLVSQSALY